MASDPAAISMVTAFTSGPIGTLLPNEKLWYDTLKADPMTKLLLDIIKNPGLSNFWSNLDKLHSVYQQPDRLETFPLNMASSIWRKYFKMALNTWTYGWYLSLFSMLSLSHSMLTQLASTMAPLAHFKKICQRYFWPGMQGYGVIFWLVLFLAKILLFWGVLFWEEWFSIKI